MACLVWFENKPVMECVPGESGDRNFGNPELSQRAFLKISRDCPDGWRRREDIQGSHTLKSLWIVLIGKKGYSFCLR